MSLSDSRSARLAAGRLAAVIRDPGTGGFQVSAGDGRGALVRSRGLIRKQYLIECAGAAFGVGGSVSGGTCWISRSAGNGRAAPIEVRRQAVSAGWMSGFQVLVSIPEGEDLALIIGLVLGLEYLCDDRRVAAGEFSSALRGIGGITSH